jgi:sensor domain CHASE-containing protein/signal transduction histidine kinase
MNSLKRKTIIVLLTSMGVFLASLSYFGLSTLLDGFRSLERSDVVDQTTRIRNRVDGELKFLSLKIGDWSSWDDLWNYAGAPNATFEKTNLLTFETLSTIDLSLMLILDTKQHLLHGLQNDAAAEKGIDVDPNIIAAVTTSSPFAKHFLANKNPLIATSGIFRFSGAPWLIVARPITSTDKKGAFRGYVIFGRILTDKLVLHWADELRMSFHRISELDNSVRKPDPDQPNIHVEILASKSHSPFTWFEEDILSYTWFMDVQGNTIIALVANFPRSIMQQGFSTILSMGGIVLLATILITFTIIVLLQKVVLDRVAHIKKETHRIAKDTSHSMRIAVTGNDELSELSQSVNKMVDTIEVRTGQVRDIMENASFGLFIAGIDGVIQDGHTKSCHGLIGQEIAGLHLSEALDFTGDQALMVRILFEQLVEDFVPPEVTLNQLPKRVWVRNSTITLSSSPLRNRDGKIDRVLFSLTDITHEVKVEQENEQNKVILRILKSRAGFLSFISQVKMEFAAIRELMTERGQIGIRLRLHTMNGNLRSFGLFSISKIVDVIESKTSIASTDIQDIETKIREWVDHNANILDLKWDQSPDQMLHEVPESVLAQFEATVTSIPSIVGEAKDVIFDFTSYTRSKSMGELLTPVAELTNDLALRLGKKVSLAVDGGDIRVHPNKIQPIFDALSHIIRNAIDHGIEDPASRTAAKKPATSNIMLTIQAIHGKTLVIKIRDDGSGIDPEKIAATAVRTGLRTDAQIENLSTTQKVALITLPGFTTRSEVTDISGRGIGMSAVQKIIVEQSGGEFLIDSVPGQGTTITLKIPMPSIGSNESCPQVKKIVKKSMDNAA